MSNRSHLSKKLVDVAMGRTPADLVIQDCKWVCVQSGEIVPHTDVAISGERIAYVGESASHTIGSATKVIDGNGRYLTPGLLDGHMHVESGMLTVTEFVRAVLPHGTTGMFVDPHEVANVLGLPGVKMMVDEAAMQPVHVFVQMPSCVPAAPGFETGGFTLGPKDVAEAVKWDGIIGLGEMMNFPGVINGDENMHEEMAIARDAGKVIGGHYASPDLGIGFHGYVASGAQDDHENLTLEDAIARARQGMRVMMRYGSAWQDVAAQVRAVTECGLDSRNFILCTDDSHAETLVNQGHMDRVIRHAITHGLSPIKAIQMATINTAEHFGVSQDLGLVAPGRYADIVLTRDLADFQAEVVIARGKLVSEKGALQIDLPVFSYPSCALESIKIDHKLQAADFRLAYQGEGKVTANVMGVIENQAPNRHLRIEMRIENGEVNADIGQDVAKIALVERHHHTGRIQIGLVHGFGFNEKCAIATSVAHDSHNIIVTGTDDESMAVAVNSLVDCGGGQVVVLHGKVVARIELPIAGLMSSERADIVALKAAALLKGFRQCGCILNSPNMQLSLAGLVVIPEIRISDLGIIDVRSFSFIPVLE